MRLTRRETAQWRKAKALNRQEFVVVGWSDPEGSRPHLGALLLGYYADDGELILKHAGRLGFEGVVSKTIDAPYAPGNRGLWRKAKALNRQEFVVVGWSDPEGSRPHLGALLLGYYTDDGKLIYAGRGYGP